VASKSVPEAKGAKTLAYGRKKVKPGQQQQEPEVEYFLILKGICMYLNLILVATNSSHKKVSDQKEKCIRVMVRAMLRR